MIKDRLLHFVGRLLQATQSRHAAYLESNTRQRFKSIGENVVLSGCNFGNPERIDLGSNIYLGPGGNLYGLGGITIGNYSILGPEVVVLSSHHNFDCLSATMIPYDQVELLKPVRIGLACWVGIRAIILPGVELGDGCVVGAGSVVTRSWSAGSILAGVPAKPIGQRDMNHFAECAKNNMFYMLQKKMHGLEKIEKPMAQISTRCI